jgi:hypothetical protein
MKLQSLLEETDRSAILKAQQELVELLPESDIRIVKIDPTQGYWKEVNDKDVGQPLSNMALCIDNKITVAMFYWDTNAASGRGFCNDVNEFMTMQPLANWVEQQQELKESARSEALEFQQYLIDEDYETKLQASKWVMRHNYGPTVIKHQETDVEGGILLLARKESDNHWTTAYHFPDDMSMGVAMYVDDPGNKHKKVAGHTNFIHSVTLKPGTNLKRWAMPA